MLSELLGALQTLIHLGKLWNYLIFLPLKVLFYVSQLMCPHCALKKKKNHRLSIHLDRIWKAIRAKETHYISFIQLCRR